MQLYYPTKPVIKTQGFSKNANTYYAENGLIGHTGYDCTGEWGSPVYATTDGFIYKIINKDNPDPMKYRCVFQLVHVHDDLYYEISYGHLNDIYIDKGQIQVGSRIGTMGNTGDVATNGRKVTRKEKESGSKAGTHLHFQVREVYRTKEGGKGQYLSSEQNQNVPYRDEHGYMYWTKNFNNGFNGCINPEPLFNGKYAADIFESYVEQLRVLVRRLQYLLFIK